MRTIIAFCFCLAAISNSAAFAAPSFSQKVAAAKQDMIEDADETFLSLWKEPSDPGDLTASQARAVSRWLTTGSYIGGCKLYAPPAIKADWLTKLDQLFPGLDAGGIAGVRAGLREVGLRGYDAPAPDALMDLSEARRRQLCLVDIEAAKQLLSEIAF